MKSVSIIPSYGRDYTSKAKVLEAWNANQDFQIQPQGCYVNKQQKEQLIKDGFTHLQFRYKKLRSTFILELK